MGRPINETQADLDREQEVAQALQSLWKCKMRKLHGMTYPADFGAFRQGESIWGVDDKLVAMVEVKWRKELHDPFYLALHKAHRMLAYSHHWDIPAMVVVGHPGGISWHRLTGGYEVYWGGNNRGQKGDKEPLVLIPRAEFQRIEIRQAA